MSTLYHARRSFHRRQMADLSTLTPGLDPDPPVKLDTTTRAYDNIIQGELRRRGWPGTAKFNGGTSAAQPPARPKPVKAACLASKVAAGSSLAARSITLIENRISWLMRNPHRWNARNGYEAIAAAKAAKRQAKAAPTNPIGGSAAGSDTRPRALDSSAKASSSPVPATALPTLPGDGRGDDLFATAPRPQHTGLLDAQQRCDVALAGLGQPAPGAGVAPSDVAQERSSPRPGGSVPTNNHLPIIRSMMVEVPRTKVDLLLNAVRHRQPRAEVLRLALDVQADDLELGDALIAAAPERQDVINVFTTLGLQVPC